MSYFVVVYKNKKEFSLEVENRPWSPHAAVKEPIEDLLDALQIVDEWGRNGEGLPRLTNKVGVYVQDTDYLIDQESCFSILNTLELAHDRYIIETIWG